VIDARAASTAPDRPQAPDAGFRSVGALIQDITAAHGRMSANNPHRAILEQCGIALGELAVQLHNERSKHRAAVKAVLDAVVDMRNVVAEHRKWADGLNLPQESLLSAIDGWEEALSGIEGVV